MKRKRFLSIIVMLFVFFGLISSNSLSVFADDSDWYIDVRDELQMPDKEWSISFSTELDKRTLNNKNIYLLDSRDRKFNDIKLEYSIEKDEEMNTSIVKVIPTREYKQGETYFLHIDKGLKSSNGNEISYPYKVEFTIKKVDSDFFKIRNVEVVSNNMLNVYFTQPINENAELPLYYELLLNGGDFVRGSYQTMKVKRIDGSDNGISIYLKEQEMSSYDEYTLNVLGDFISEYNIRLNNGTGDTSSFYGVDDENKTLAVTVVEALSDSLIKVNFNKPFDRTSAKLKNNYILEDSKGSNKSLRKISLSKDSRSVEFSVYPGLKRNEEYTLTIKDIEDKFNLTELKTEEHNVEWISSLISNIEITSVEAVNRRVINVYFDRPLDKNYAARTSYYKVEEAATGRMHTTPAKVYYNPDENPNVVKLFLRKDVREDKEYKLEVSKSLKDSMGYSFSKTAEYEFEGCDIKYRGVDIKNAVIIGNDHIKLAFTGEIMNKGTNLERDNYTLVCKQGENRQIIIECSEVRYVDDTTIILTFEGLNFDEDYVIKINSLVDCLGESTDIYSDGVDVIYREE